MGPRRRWRGNQDAEDARSWSRLLQWGRAVDGAEMQADLVFRVEQDMLQWGRAVDGAEMSTKSRFGRSSSGSFNGAAP